MSSDSEEWANSDNYEVVRKISLGHRRFSNVFEGVKVPSCQRCIIKSFKFMDPERIKQEIKILQTLRGGPNILSFADVVLDYHTRLPSLIFEYVDNTDFRSLYPRFNKSDIQHYINELVKALDFCHSQGVMHRDIRPHNVMIDHAKGKLRLFGWDSAEFYTRNFRYNTRVSGGCSKAPELLLHYEEYDYSLDMWNFGAMFASMIFKKEPFFHGVSNFDQLERIARVLGTKGLLNYVEMYDMETMDMDAIEYFERRPWHSFFNCENQRFADDKAVDLLDKLLRWDHKERLTARQALRHPYFDSIPDPEH